MLCVWKGVLVDLPCSQYFEVREAGLEGQKKWWHSLGSTFAFWYAYSIWQPEG